MADKETALSIVIRTVDRATAGIQAINKKLDEATKPTREFSKALGELKEKSGFNAVAEGFHGVAEGAKEALWKVVEVGAVVGEVTHLVLEMAESFAKLGHTAEKDGVTVDFLASMRNAAQKSGVGIEQLDEGLTTFGQNLGLARGGMGRMFKFLESKAPTLLTQLKATKDNGKAFLLLADAMAAVTDPAKRLALAQKTVGDNALAVVLAKGSKELIKQQAAYLARAGSQEKAAKAGIEIEDAMVDLKAASDGVKAALVTGLAPALKGIIDRMQEWLVEHRPDIERWAEDIGQRLPGAIDKVVDAIKSVVDKVSWLADIFGGANLVIGSLAAVILGPLVASLATLGLALVANPFGLIVVGVAGALAGVAALAKAIYDVVHAIDEVKASAAHEQERNEALRMSKGGFEQQYGKFDPDAPGVTDEGRRFYYESHPELSPSYAKNPGSFLRPISPAELMGPPPGSPAEGMSAFLGRYNAPQADIKVTFENAPKGMRAQAAPNNTANVDLTVGHQFGGTP